MWLSLLSLVLGAVPAITREIANAKIELAKTKTEQDRIAAQERINALEAKRDVLIAESRTPWNSVVRAVLIAPAAFYLSWTIVWDKITCKWFYIPDRIAGTCTTDPLSDWQSAIVLTMIGFYFVTDLTKVIKR